MSLHINAEFHLIFRYPKWCSSLYLGGFSLIIFLCICYNFMIKFHITYRSLFRVFIYIFRALYKNMCSFLKDGLYVSVSHCKWVTIFLMSCKRPMNNQCFPSIIEKYYWFIVKFSIYWNQSLWCIHVFCKYTS